MTEIDLSPGRLDVRSQRGQAVVLDLEWPEDLTGRAFSASCGSIACPLVLAGTTMTLTIPETATNTASKRRLSVVEDGDILITGHWTPTIDGTTSPAGTVTVVVDPSVSVDVTVQGRPGESWELADPLEWASGTTYPARTVVEHNDVLYVSRSTTTGNNPSSGGPWQAVPSNADVAAREQIARLHVDVRDFGAVGDGVTNDRQAFVSAAATFRPVYVPPGNYYFDGPALTGYPNPIFFGADKARSKITIAPGGYFLSPATGVTRMRIEHLTFEGGAGVYRNEWVGVIVHGHRVVRDCEFRNYTGAAFASDVLDEPYWNFEYCQFAAAQDLPTTMGIALAGSSDGSTFYGCSFIRNRIDIKFRRMGTAKVDCTDFIPYNAGEGSPRARIWIIPANQAQGMITNCKFGNENIAAGDYHILIADDSASGHVGSSFPVLGADSTGVTHGLQVAHSSVQGASGAAPPLIYSTTPNLRGFMVGPTHFFGSRPTNVVEFRSPPPLSRFNLDSVVGPVLGSAIATEFGQSVAPSNAPEWAKTTDPQGVFSVVAAHPAADPTSYSRLLPTLINSFVMVNATKAPIPDALGGTDAAEVTFSTATGFIYNEAGLTAANIKIGQPAWIEFDVAKGDTSPLTHFRAHLRYTSNGEFHWARYLTVPEEGWVRHRFMWVPQEKAVAIILSFTPGGTGTGSLKIGRVRVYHSREPLNIDRATVIGGVPKREGLIAAKAFRNANQSIPNATDTAVELNAEAFDTDNMHDNSVNPSRITVPVAGKYDLAAGARFAAHATGERRVSIYKNGSAVVLINQPSASGSQPTWVGAAGLATAAAGDYFEMFVQQTSGGALDVNAGEAATWLAVRFVGE
jgi:hypothetical protein